MDRGAAAAAYEPSGAAARKAPVRRTRKALASLTRFWHLWCTKDSVVIPTEGPAWEQARRPWRGWA